MCWYNITSLRVLFSPHRVILVSYPKSAILLKNGGSSWYVYLPPNAKGAAYKKFVEIFELFSLKNISFNSFNNFNHQ